MLAGRTGAEVAIRHEADEATARAEGRVEAIATRAGQLAELPEVAVEDEDVPVRPLAGAGQVGARLEDDVAAGLVDGRLQAVADAGGQLNGPVERLVVEIDLAE